MKKRNLSNIIFLLVTILALSCLSPFSVFATSADEEGTETEKTLEWTYNEDGTLECSNGMIYKEYPLPKEYYIVSRTRYVYARGIEIDGEYCEITSISKDHGILELDSESMPTVYYVTEESRLKLDKFFSGETDSYYLEKYAFNLIADLDNSTYEHILSDGKNSAEKITIEVTELRDLEKYYVMGRDESKTFGIYIGIIFEMDDSSYYYLDYSTLTNNNFDANGNLSFRSGSVTVYKLSHDTSELINQTKNRFENYTTTYEYESDPLAEKVMAIIGLVFFVIGFAFMGFIAPVSFIVLGIIMATRKPKGSARYWYVVSACALFWLTVSVITLAAVALLVLI